ncbi:MAG: hypothetical protein KGI67_13870 [Pseudomonadota bacterium]|nr:hypothetical protein [Pseudomonadota bacterium]
MLSEPTELMPALAVLVPDVVPVVDVDVPVLVLAVLAPLVDVLMVVDMT